MNEWIYFATVICHKWFKYATLNKNTRDSVILNFRSQYKYSQYRGLHGKWGWYRNEGDLDRKCLGIIGVGYSCRWVDGQGIWSARSVKEQEGWDRIVEFGCLLVWVWSHSSMKERKESHRTGDTCPWEYMIVAPYVWWSALYCYLHDMWPWENVSGI